MEQRNKKTQFAINVTTGWLSLSVTIAVGIAQLPYLFWRLGPETFGIFQLANSALSLFLFLQLGMQPTLVRYLSTSVSQDNHTEIYKVSSTTLSILIALGMFGALLISLSSPAFVSFYDIPTSIHTQTYGLIFCLAGVFLINFLAVVPSSILMATQRYDAINITNTIAPIVRLTLIIISFELIGSSIYTLGIIILAVQLLRLLTIQVISARQFGWKPILSLANARWDTFKKIYKFSFFTFLHSIFSSLVFQGPVFIIGKLLGLESAGYYAPTRVAADAISKFMAHTVSPLIPLASSARVEKNFAKIGMWSIRICQIMVSLGLFIAYPFCIAGQEITTIWLGEEKAFLWSIIAVTAVGTAIARGGTANGSLALGGGSIVPTMVSMGVLALALPLGILILYTLGFDDLLSIVILITLADIFRSILYIPFAYSKQFKYQPLDYIYRGYFKPILAFGISLAIVWDSVWYLSPPRNEWNHLGVLSMIFAGCSLYVALLWLIALDSKNKDLISGFSKKITTHFFKPPISPISKKPTSD